MFLVGKVLDSSFNLRRIIDVYSSFIWNEYYVGYGDFQLKWPMDASALNYIQEGWYIAIDQSDKLMIIERIAIETDVQNGNYAVIEGRSLESILLRRFIRDATVISGDFQTGIMRLVNANARTADASNRQIPRLAVNLSEDPAITSLEMEAEYSPGDNLYDAICGLCEYQRVGFRIVPNYDDTSFTFELYSGADRSYKQNVNAWVVFSSKYENLKSSNMAIDTRELKNAAIVDNTYTYKNENTGKSEEHTITVEINPEVSGLERREVYMTCNIKPEDVDKSQFGKAEDRVNIRDYQNYECIYFDSKGYKDACDAVNEKYNSRIDSPREEKIWVKDIKSTSIGPGGLNTVIGYIPMDSPSWEKSRSASPASTKAARVSTYASSGPGSDPTNPGDPSNKPSWLDTPPQSGWKLTTVKESAESWQARNERTFAAWERNMPDRRDYETWGWVFKPGGQSAYNAALQAAQDEIDAEYDAAVEDEVDKVREQMMTLGQIELAQYSVISNFEGEVDPNVQFIYGRDYGMGDVVQIINEYNFQATTRVVSMLFSEEEGEGFKAMPTFESDDPSEVDI